MKPKTPIEEAPWERENRILQDIEEELAREALGRERPVLRREEWEK